MPKINSWVVGLSILFSQIIICSPNFALERKPIIFAGDQNYPPVEYVQDGKPTGMFNELLQELSKVMGRRIEHQLGVWKESQKKVLNGEADALTVFGITEERRKLYDFTESIFPMEFTLFVQSDNLLIHTINDLKGKRVGITQGGLPKQILTPKKQIHIVFIENYLEGFRLLLSGKIDAVAANKWVGAYTLQQEGIKGIKLIQKPFTISYAPMAVKKGNLKLLNELNEGIRKLKKTGAIDEIVRRWSSQEIVFLTKEKIRRVLIIAGMAGFIIVFSIITLWAITLRKQNNKLHQEIIERQRAKEALRIYQENLENLVTERTAELSTINVQLQREISERQQAEDSLRESQSFLVKAQEIASVGSWRWQSDSDEGIWSDQTFRILGYAPNEIQPTYKWLLGVMHPDDREPVMKGIEESMSTGESYDMEYRLTRKDQTKIVVHSRGEVVSNQAGDSIGMIGVIHDITERKQAERQITSSLKEKEVLLSEIHHRVKNNMQVMISLLRLQADKIGDKKYADMFKEGEDRIRSMAIIHEKLYQSQDVTRIDFGEYVKSLVDGIFLSHGADTNKIRLNMDIKDVSFDLENAIPCGLIINELVSNSLKHAFPHKKEGQISINLQPVSEDEFELMVGDDGVGMPEELDIRNTDTMGLSLIKVLAEHQLNGKITLNRTEGTQFYIKFKRAAYKPRI